MRYASLIFIFICLSERLKLIQAKNNFIKKVQCRTSDKQNRKHLLFPLKHAQC